MNKNRLKKHDLINLEVNSIQTTHWVNRVLFVLSFKDVHTQNLRFITKVLGINTSTEKKEYLKELLKMVQRGIIYISKGLPYLIENESKFDLDNPKDLESIEICLLHPFKKILSEVQAELLQHTNEENTFTVDVH
jgi:hypothetical protein